MDPGAVQKAVERMLLWHNGDTNDFRGFAGLVLATGVGAVALANNPQRRPRRLRPLTALTALTAHAA